MLVNVLLVQEELLILEEASFHLLCHYPYITSTVYNPYIAPYYPYIIPIPDTELTALGHAEAEGLGESRPADGNASDLQGSRRTAGDRGLEQSEDIGYVHRLYKDYIGRMEKKMETTIVYYGIYIGII